MVPVKKQQKYLNILEGQELFRGVQDGLVQRAFENSACECAQYEAGEIVYPMDRLQRHLGFVLSGKLRAIKTTARAGAVVLNVFTSGKVFGMAGVFCRDISPICQVEAIKRSRILWVPKLVLLDLFQRDYRAAENYIACLSDRIGFLNSRIGNFTAGTAEDKLASFLIGLPLREDGTVLLPCSMLQLSEILGMGRASLYRAMDSLQEAGVISRQGRLITILRPVYSCRSEEKKPGGEAGRK